MVSLGDVFLLLSGNLTIVGSMTSMRAEVVLNSLIVMKAPIHNQGTKANQLSAERSWSTKNTRSAKYRHGLGAQTSTE